MNYEWLMSWIIVKIIEIYLSMLENVEIKNAIEQIASWFMELGWKPCKAKTLQVKTSWSITLQGENLATKTLEGKKC
jgi:hypothetical protein